MHVKISPAMKRLTILLFLLIIAIISAIVLGLPLPQAIQDLLPNAIVKPNPVDKPGYTLLFQEEFEQPQLDLTRWNTQYWWGRVNGQELQYYEEDAFSINDGKLNIQARRNKLHDKNYTSGVITTLNTFSFQYGYVEVYAKLPKELQESLKQNQQNMFIGGKINPANFNASKAGMARFKKFDDGWRLSDVLFIN